jgi:sugar phosphate isomerase/epimerase
MFDVPQLSLSLTGLSRHGGEPWSGGPRAAIAWAASAGFRAVQLDAAMPGVRGRDLDRSARRDLASLLRRGELALSGLDLLIPPRHFLDESRVDRALAAVLGAIDLAADLGALGVGGSGGGEGKPVVCIELPGGAGPVRSAITERADARGVRVADCGAGPAEPGSGEAGPGERGPGELGGPIGLGLDPASVLLRGDDPGAVAARAGAGLVQARLSDASSSGRVLPGEGSLDGVSYLVGLGAARYDGSVVLDLRGLASQDLAAGEARRWWERVL